MALNNYADGKLLDYLFGNATLPAIPNLFFGLSQTTIAQDGTGITEPSGGGYQRTSIANTATNFPAATVNGTSGMRKQNGTIINFPSTGTATASWGTVTHWFVSDATTGGNIIAFGAFGTPKTISNGDTASFAANQLTIDLQ